MRARVRASKGVARVYFFTEAPAEFQHHSHECKLHDSMNSGSQESCMLC